MSFPASLVPKEGCPFRPPQGRSKARAARNRLKNKNARALV